MFSVKEKQYIAGLSHDKITEKNKVTIDTTETNKYINNKFILKDKKNGN